MANVLIQGAGIAGCALAAMLRKQGHAVTVVERASSPRQGGQAVDVRGAALKVVERMDLIQDVRACRTTFRGMSVCNELGGEDEAEAHFGGLAMWVAGNGSASSERTRAVLGWEPREGGLISDIERPNHAK